MKIYDLVVIICVGMLVRLAAGLFFDEYGILAYQQLASYEAVLVGNLSALEQISDDLENLPSADLLVEAPAISLGQNGDVVVRSEEHKEALMLGTLHLSPPSPPVIRKILRTVSVSSSLLLFLAVALHRFMKKKQEVEFHHTYKGLTSR